MINNVLGHLEAEQKTFLAEHGYLNLGKLLTDDEVSSVNQRLAELLHEEGDNAGSELLDSKYIKHPKEAGADRLADLVNKGEVFDKFYTHEKVLCAVHSVLGDQFKLSSLNYRAALPGKGLQKLHVDWKNDVAQGTYKVCNSIWLLDDFTEDNGATRIVPGTHLLDQRPEDVLEDQEAKHPDEIIITAPAGTVFIFNSHVWHGGTTNHTSKPRRSIHSYFCTREQAQQIDQRRYILDNTKHRIGNLGQYILDV